MPFNLFTFNIFFKILQEDDSKEKPSVVFKEND